MRHVDIALSMASEFPTGNVQPVIPSIIHSAEPAVKEETTGTLSFIASITVTEVPSVIGETGLGKSVLFEHETGTDQVNPDGSVTTLTSFIQSYDFSLQTDPQLFRGVITDP